jgi:hypothetical protein
LPAPYKTIQVKIIAIPPDKGESTEGNKIWTEDSDGTPKKRLIFSKSGDRAAGLLVPATHTHTHTHTRSIYSLVSGYA